MGSCGISRKLPGDGVRPGDTAYGLRESHTTLVQCQGNQLQVAATIGEPVCRPHPSRAGTGADGARGMLRMVQAKGAGYAISREEELQATLCVAQATGEHVLPPFPAFYQIPPPLHTDTWACQQDWPDESQGVQGMGACG